MKNDSFFNRIPLPLLIVVWLGLVGLGAVLVYMVFFSRPADSTARPTPIAQVTRGTSLAYREDAARSLGLSPFATWLRVNLPLARPAVVRGLNIPPRG